MWRPIPNGLVEGSCLRFPTDLVRFSTPLNTCAAKAFGLLRFTFFALRLPNGLPRGIVMFGLLGQNRLREIEGNCVCPATASENRAL